MASSRIHRVCVFLLVVVSVSSWVCPAMAQVRRGGRPSPFTEIKWDVYTFRFLPGNQMAQVLDANGHLIGTILDQGGGLKLMPTVTGADADKLQKSFQAWKDQGGEAAVGYKPASPAPAQPTIAGPGSSTSAKSGLTVDGVVSMLGAGLSDDIIVEKIHKSGQSFDLSADDLVRLKKAKASDPVIKAMMEATPASTAAPAQTAAAAPSSSAPAGQSSTPPVESAKNGGAGSKSGGGIGSVFKSTSDVLHGRSVIDRVGLRNILPQWDPQKPVSEQFPHVAITVLYAPTGWMDPYETDKSAKGQSLFPPCFKLEAVVWSDADHSRKVGPFEWCSNKDEFLAQLEPDYAYSLIPRQIERGYVTGVNRTEGPAPPETLIPNDRPTMDMEAKTNPQGRSIDLNHDNQTCFAMMFANVRKDLGETLTTDGDSRVWIVAIKKAAGPSLF